MWVDRGCVDVRGAKWYLGRVRGSEAVDGVSESGRVLEEDEKMSEC